MAGVVGEEGWGRQGVCSCVEMGARRGCGASHLDMDMDIHVQAMRKAAQAERWPRGFASAEHICCGTGLRNGPSTDTSSLPAPRAAPRAAPRPQVVALSKEHRLWQKMRAKESGAQQQARAPKRKKGPESHQSQAQLYGTATHGAADEASAATGAYS